MSVKIRVCDNCSVATIEKLQLCGGCKYIYYCNQQCQTEHWPIHKHDCKEMSQLAVARKSFDMFCKDLRRDKLPLSEPGHKIRACLIQINDLAKFTANNNIKRLVNTPIGMKTANLSYICTSYDNYDTFIAACQTIVNLTVSDSHRCKEIFRNLHQDTIRCLIHCPEINNYSAGGL